MKFSILVFLKWYNSDWGFNFLLTHWGSKKKTLKRQGSLARDFLMFAGRGVRDKKKNIYGWKIQSLLSEPQKGKWKLPSCPGVISDNSFLWFIGVCVGGCWVTKTKTIIKRRKRISTWTVSISFNLLRLCRTCSSRWLGLVSNWMQARGPPGSSVPVLC